jgi:hypothetical protein
VQVAPCRITPLTAVELAVARFHFLRV